MFPQELAGVDGTFPLTTEMAVADSDSARGGDSPCARSGRLSGLVSWIVVAGCCASLVVYLALHARELRLIGEWLTFE